MNYIYFLDCIKLGGYRHFLLSLQYLGTTVCTIKAPTAFGQCAVAIIDEYAQPQSPGQYF